MLQMIREGVISLQFSQKIYNFVPCRSGLLYKYVYAYKGWRKL